MILQRNSYKTTGLGGIPALDANTLQAFQDALENIWSMEEMPEDFSDALIVYSIKTREAN